MKCFNCKYEFDEDVSTCPACGSTNIVAEKEDYIVKSTCPNCHASLNGEDTCPTCGIDINNYGESPVLSQETQEKIVKVGKAVGLTFFLIDIIPFIGLVLLIAIGMLLVMLLGKGIVTEIQLANIIKVIFIVVPVVCVLLFSNFKQSDKKPVLRKVMLGISILFIALNIIYCVQPIVKFSNYGNEEVLKIDDYSIPTIAKIYKGKAITSIKIRESEGTAYSLTYEGNLPKEALNEYISLLENEGFSKELIDDTRFQVYVKYDGRNSMLIKIDPGSPYIYQKCTNSKCVDQKIRDTYGVQYWFINGDYHEALKNMNEPVKHQDDEEY